MATNELTPLLHAAGVAIAGAKATYHNDQVLMTVNGTEYEVQINDYDVMIDYVKENA